MAHLFLMRGRQDEIKRYTLVGLAFSPETAAVQGDKLLGDGQPQSTTTSHKDIITERGIKRKIEAWQLGPRLPRPCWPTIKEKGGNYPQEGQLKSTELLL